MEVRQDIWRLYEEDHLSEREIAKKLGVSASTVHYWIAHQGQKACTKKGRPRSTNPFVDQDIYKASLQNPFLTAVDIQRDMLPACSVDTIRNRLKLYGMKCRTPARKPFLTAHHRQMRYAYALSYLHYTTQEWKRVVFSDEKIFRSSSRGALHVYRPTKSDRYGDQYLVPSTNPTGPRFTICVWMAFGGGGKIRALHRIERKTLNADYYTTRVLPTIERQLAEDDVENMQRLVFQQDLSSIHTSKLTKQWLHEHNIRVMDEWPPRGPDMNPVENVWAELVRRIVIKRKRMGVYNKDHLWEDVNQAFLSLPESYFEKLVGSMSERVRKVFQKRGGWTKY